MTEPSQRTIRCPICKKQVALGDPFMPFCSDRCRILDLANWADEKYVITGPVQSEDEDLLQSDNLGNDFSDHDGRG